jgi:hypothetical protein
MAGSEIERPSSNDAVELLLERQAARELWSAASFALGVAAVSEDSAGADQTEDVDTFFMTVRRSSALELLNALAVNFDFPTQDGAQSLNATDAVRMDDLVAIAIDAHTATVILNALTFSLGSVGRENNPGMQRGGADIVRTIISQSTALELLTSLVTNVGSVQSGLKAGKDSRKPAGQDGILNRLIDPLPHEEYSAEDELLSLIDVGQTEGPIRRRGSLGKKKWQSDGGSPLDRSLPAGDSQEQADEIDCTVYAPGEASLSNSFLVQVFAHLPEQAAAVEQIAKEAEPGAGRRVGKTLDQKIQRGSRLTFDLTMAGLEIDEPSQSIFWRGKPESVQFAVSVPKDFEPKNIVGTVTVSESTIPIGHLKFTFKVVAVSTAATANTQSVLAGNLIRYQQAFISYASPDRAEVLKRVQMLNASKVKFFQDLLTLEPGDHWEKLIYEYIDRSDVFYLFWSTAASKSHWVKKEIDYARSRQAGKDEAPPEIVPILIEGPPPPKPPEELSFLHFNDKFLYFIKAEERET